MRPVRGGYEVILLKSKTSKTEHTFTITNRDVPSLKRWLDAWVAHAEIKPGTPLFRGVDRWQRISPARLSRRRSAPCCVGGCRRSFWRGA